MEELFNAVSSGSFDGCNSGNNIISGGDSVILVVTTYKASEGLFFSDAIILVVEELYGSMMCVSDSGGCTLDGEWSRRILNVDDTLGETLTLRALTFKDGMTIDTAGAIYTGPSSIVDIVLCAFSNCVSNLSGLGGGAIEVEGPSTVINIYGSSFTNNTAASAGKGDDIYCQDATIVVNDDCPSPYEDTTPDKGAALDNFGEIGGSLYSYSGCADGQAVVA